MCTVCTINMKERMNNSLIAIKNFINDEQGATAIEYGLLVALISLALIAGASAFGAGLGDLFDKLADCLANPGTGTAACTFP
jgi:pilus assembly protein Flp/PilA